MDDLIKNGSLLAAIAGLSFFIIGLFQWVLGLTKASDNKRLELLGKLEECRLEGARLKGQLIIYSDKLEDFQTQLVDYKKRYQHYKDLYDKTQLAPEIPPKPPALN